MKPDNANVPPRIPDPEQLLDFLLEHIPDVIFFKDRRHRFLRVNRVLLRLFGLNRQEEVIGKTDFDFLQPEDAERTREDERQVMASGEPIIGRITQKHHADGSPWWALTTKMPLENAEGTIIGTCGISRDITALKAAEDAFAHTNAELERTLAELKAAQAQLIESEKAQSISRLAAGIAHEVRNPLAVLTMGLDFLSSVPELNEDASRSEVLEEMREALRRADHVITTLMEGSRPSGLNLKKIAINGLVAQAVAHLAEAFKAARIDVVEDFAPGSPSVMADGPKLSQVLEGLMANALEAMPGGGVLKIQTRVQTLTAESVTRDAGTRRAQLFHAGEGIVRINMTDTGCGISEAALPRIYDAFFTTKETGPEHGLGLGLTTCRAILELHGGLLAVVNRGDRSGVRATIQLRLCE